MEETKKILYLTTTSKIAGAEKMLYELVKRLDKSKYLPVVGTIKDDLEGQLLEKLREEGVKTFCLDVDKKWKALKVIKLLGIVWKEKPDILQTFLFFDNVLGSFTGKILRGPTVISGQRNANPHQSKTRNLVERLTLSLTDLVISNNQAGKDLLLKKYDLPGKKIKVIPNALEDEKISNKNKSKGKLLSKLSLPEKLKRKFIIGFVGSLTEQKGVINLLKAVSGISKKDFVLIIIGEGERKDHLSEFVVHEGLGKNVFFTGYQPEAYRYMNLFDIFVLPSLWEGMPNVILEAMANGLPVVATEVGDNKELIADNNFLVKPGDPERLKRAILKLKNMSEKEKNKIGKKNRMRVNEEFTFKKMVRKYEELYSRF